VRDAKGGGLPHDQGRPELGREPNAEPGEFRDYFHGMPPSTPVSAAWWGWRAMGDMSYGLGFGAHRRNELTSSQEKEVEDLMTESFSKNFIDYEEYPQSADIQNRCVNMIGRLFNAPTGDPDAAAVGTSTVGSSEAIMLSVLAMKKKWQNKRKAEGKDWHNPNIIMSSAVQVCWEKAARYFEVEEKYVNCTPERYVLDPEETVSLVDENTIGICVILGTTYTGEYEDAKAINDLLVKKKIDTVIHIDAASGGFVAPFVVPELEWDFRLEKVVSINVSGHK
jgi:glutamate decarboxylase